MQDEGIEGEQKLGRYLKEKSIHYLQPDAIGKEGGAWVVYETKMKDEPFKPPPFYGHGLEVYQVKARLQLHKEKDMRCKFIVFQKNNSVVCSQWLDILEEGEHFDTKNGIRIYPLTNFDIEEWSDENSTL